MRLNTKEKREESRKYQFEYLTKNGYLMTEYKNLVIFHHPTELLLKSFWGTAANHSDFYWYRTPEQMQSKINELKNIANRRETWKAEQMERKSLAGAKITLSTLKKFIRENAGNIYVKVLSSFDGMTDCVERVEDDFKLMTIKEDNGNNLGLSGVHLVGSSRDSFTAYNSNEFEGIEIYNSCGSCIVARNKETTQQTQTPAEVPAGKIQIVDYSEKAFAVIGETKPIKDGLKNLGGKFNFRLTCGAGWIFSKTKLEAVKAFLIESKGNETTQEEQPTAEPETTLKDEVKKTIEFFAEHDIKMCGQITESTKEAAKVQKVDLSGLIDEAPQHYNNLQDMEAAAQSGKVISLLNMCELVNAK